MNFKCAEYVHPKQVSLLKISVAFFDGQGCKLQQGRREAIEAIALFFFCKGEDDEVH